MSEATEKVVDTKEKGTNFETSLLDQAHQHFRISCASEQENRNEAIDDLNMLAGKNHWPKEVLDQREGRPCLVINKLPAFVDQVQNDARLNRMAIRVKPNGSGATVEMAKTLEGLIRNIEGTSKAYIAYQTGLDGATNNGFGYFRVVTDYADDSSFDQEIRIKRVKNPLTVYLDPRCSEPDGRDGRFGFVTEMVPRKEYEVRFPGKHLTPFSEISETDGMENWYEEDQVRIAEYWVKEPKEKKLYLLSDGRTVEAEEWDAIVDELIAGEITMHLEPNPQDPQGQPVPVEGPAPEGSGFPEEVINPTPEIVRERIVQSHVVVQYLIDGSQILEGPTEWPGKYIPIIPVWGKEIIIDSKRHLRGVIRFAKDSQRIYNYFRSSATETVALAPKAPWVAADEQLEGHDEWDDANEKNYAVLRYKHLPNVPPPQRNVVSQTAIGEITEANISNEEMKSTTSLYDASLGAQSNERTGRAIMARQREGDVANYTYHDNLKIALEFCGDILIDLIPNIYDTERQLTIVGEDGEEKFVSVNQAVVDVATGKKVILNDLSIGRYKVSVSTGPSFSTRREEAAQSMLDFIRVAPESASMVIDLIAENMDWPGAVKIANRFKKMLELNFPGIDEEGPLQPQQPSLDDQFKALKMQGTTLGNELKKLDIVQQRSELEGLFNQIAQAGAQGAMQAIGIGGKNE